MYKNDLSWWLLSAKVSVTPCLPINSITTLHPMSGIWEPWVPPKGHGLTRSFMLKNVQHWWHLSHSSSTLSGNLSPLICSCLVLISFSAGIIKLSGETLPMSAWYFSRCDYHFMDFIVIMIILFDSQHGSLVNNKSITANVFCLSLMSCLNAREHPWS